MTEIKEYYKHMYIFLKFASVQLITQFHKEQWDQHALGMQCGDSVDEQ